MQFKHIKFMNFMNYAMYKKKGIHQEFNYCLYILESEQCISAVKSVNGVSTVQMHDFNIMYEDYL